MRVSALSDSFARQAGVTGGDAGGVMRFGARVTVLEGALDARMKREIQRLEKRPDDFQCLGRGGSGDVYLVKDPGNPTADVVVKVSHVGNTDSFGHFQFAGVSFEKEAEMLKAFNSVQDSKQPGQHFIARLKTPRRHYLVTTFSPGRAPDPLQNPLRPNHLKSLLERFVALDVAGILHRDLKKDNILTLHDSANLIDFGEAVRFSPLDIQGNSEVHNFPPFQIPANTQSFEDIHLFPYLEALSQKGKTGWKLARTFRDYLTLRSDLHQKRAAAFERLVQQVPESGAGMLKRAVQYEDLQARLFWRPDPDLVDLEADRIQMTYAAHIAYDQEMFKKNPVANLQWKLFSMVSVNRFMARIQEMKQRVAEGSPLAQFLAFQQELAEYRREKIGGWLKGSFDWIYGNLMGRFDGQPSAVGMQEQLSQFEAKPSTAVVNVAELIRRD